MNETTVFEIIFTTTIIVGVLGYFCYSIYLILTSPFPLFIPDDLMNKTIDVDKDVSFLINCLENRIISIRSGPNGFERLCVYDGGWKYSGGKQLKKEISRKIRKHIIHHESKKYKQKVLESKRLKEKWETISKQHQGD